MPAKLVLASQSPQRCAILEQLGVDFEALAPEVEEVAAGPPRETVVDNALRKANAVRARVGDGRPVLGVDTEVVLASRVYGKPRDEPEARAFLESLSGRSHQVWSGIALLPGRPAGRGGEQSGAGAGTRRAALTGAAATEVRFRRLRPAEVEWYLHSGEWRDRAGGYAIQGRGAALVERIAGDYWNVVGLPVPELLRLAPELVTAGSRSSVTAGSRSSAPAGGPSSVR